MHQQNFPLESGRTSVFSDDLPNSAFPKLPDLEQARIFLLQPGFQYFVDNTADWDGLLFIFSVGTHILMGIGS